MVSMMPWQPVVDGTTIPAPPIDRIGAGCASTIDLIVGSATEEFRFFLVPSGAIDAMTPEMLAGVIAGYGMPVEETLAKYRALYPGATAGDLIAAVQSDWYFRAPAARLAETHSKSATSGTTHLYEFAWRSPQFGGRLGACHGLDVAFVFDVFDEGTEALSGKTPPRQLADAMHGAWVEFARSGRCAWPVFDLKHRTRMRFDAESHVVQD